MTAAAPALKMTEPNVTFRIGKEGNDWVGVAVVQTGRAPIVIHARVNEDKIRKAIISALQGRAAAAGVTQVGFFGFLKKAAKAVAHAVKKVARSKVAKAIYGGVRKVMKSPITKLAVSATAVAFPAVGIPAAAAFYTANKVLDSVEKGGKIAATVQKKIAQLSKLARRPGKTGAKARRALKVLKTTYQWRKGLQVAERHRPTVRRPPSLRRGRPMGGTFHGAIRLPNGKVAKVHGKRSGNKVLAAVALPNGRRAGLLLVVPSGNGAVRGAIKLPSGRTVPVQGKRAGTTVLASVAFPGKRKGGLIARVSGDDFEVATATAGGVAVGDATCGCAA